MFETCSVFFLWKETIRENPDLQLERYKDDLTASGDDEEPFQTSAKELTDDFK